MAYVPLFPAKAHTTFTVPFGRHHANVPARFDPTVQPRSAWTHAHTAAAAAAATS